MLVPQFADHCFIDLYQGDQLVRRVQRHASELGAAAGYLGAGGEQIHYPEGHSASQAMARLDTIEINDLESGGYPAAQRGEHVGRSAGRLTSVIAAPLYARGELLGRHAPGPVRLTEREVLTTTRRP